MSTKFNEPQLVSSLVQLLEFDNESSEGSVIFLNGPWGSGKTFFWKNSVQTKLVKNKCLYVSLFGVQNISDLREKIVAAILAGGQDDGIIAKGRRLLSKLNVSSLLGKFTGIEVKCDILELIPFRYVVCFDDLERLPKDASVEEILGFINYLSEHKAYRCLVILNQLEMKDSHKDDFLRLREKLSLRTFQLPFDLEQRFDAFLSTKAQLAQVQVLPNEADMLKRIVLSTKTDNLRTVRFILDCYLQLRKGINNDLPEEVCKFLVAMIDYEAKGNVNDWTFYSFNPMEVYFGEHSRKKENSKEESKPDPRSEFYFKYFGENAPYRAYQCAFDVIKRGYFDAEAGRNELFPAEANLSDAEKLAKQIQETHFFFSNDDELRALIEQIHTLFKSAPELTFQSIFSFAKGLSSAIRLLELPEPTSLPEGFEKAALQAVTKLENPTEYASDFGHRTNDLLKVYSDPLKKICTDEAARRKQAEMETALTNGTTKGLKDQLIESTQVLEQVMSSGQIEKIWKSTTLEREEVYRLLEIIIKAMVTHSHHNAKVKAELAALHKYLTDRYNESKEKMIRLRTYRLLEACGMGLPKDPPALAPRN